MEQDDWQTEHFNNRRIGHGRKGKGSAKGGVFDPRRSYGVYQLQCPALAKLPAGDTAVQSKNDAATIEIHGPVEGRDDALMCSIELPGRLSGVAIVAGSRKVLGSVVQDLEHPESEEEESDSEKDVPAGERDETEDSDAAEEEPDQEREPKSSIELADEKERRRYAAFEKNSFRAPKFWMRWRAVVSTTGVQEGEPLEAAAESGKEPSSPQRQPSNESVEVNGGYLVFSGNDCASFNGTISCANFDWKNVKLSGTKVVSKARECPRRWTEIVASDS